MNANPDDSISLERRGLELEYTTLRGEIVKRIEMRQQIIAITLTLAGIFLAVGLGTESVVLIYPLLAAFLAFGWAQNDFRIKDAAKYIRENLEGSLPGLRYETFVQQRRDETKGFGSWRFVVLSHGGVFLVTQILAVGIEISKFSFDTLKWALLGVDLVAVLVVIWLMTQAGRKTKG